MSANIRKIIVQVDEIHQEMGRPVSPPTRRALAMAVIATQGSRTGRSRGQKRVPSGV